MYYMVILIVGVMSKLSLIAKHYIVILLFFVIKQKTAYEMRISDWSSDVCSSDLGWRLQGVAPGPGRQRHPGCGPWRSAGVQARCRVQQSQCGSGRGLGALGQRADKLGGQGDGAEPGRMGAGHSGRPTGRR